MISYVFVSSFFANRLNHCRNFSIQANVRRRVFQLEHRNRRQFKEAVGLTVVTYTSFFTSRFSSVTFSNCFLASDPHFYARRMGLSASVLFSENSCISRPRLTSSAGFSLPGQCLHCSAAVRSRISPTRFAT